MWQWMRFALARVGVGGTWPVPPLADGVVRGGEGEVEVG